MPYEQHLFISYAHLDNRPLTSEQEGWVSRFHAVLRTVLAMRLGYEPKIWRDDKLRGNDIFDDEILHRLRRSALLVSVVTPRYLESEWCPKEVREFCVAMNQLGGLSIGNRSRLFKLIKTPIDEDHRLPEQLRNTLGYAFFSRAEGDAPLELDPAYGRELAQAFNRKVAVLAWNIAEVLQLLSTDKKPPAENGTVYVAESSYDRADEREQLIADLRLSGYAVLPAQPLPRDEAHYVEEVASLLARSQLSIHLIGDKRGFVPDGPSGKSGVQLQNELAARHSASSGLGRVISLPPDTLSDQPDHAAFLEALHREPDAQVGAELVTGDLEHVKMVVRTALEAQQDRDSDLGKAPALAHPLVYVLCTDNDRLETVGLLKALRQAGLDPRLPVFSGNAAAVRRAHESMLTECAGALLFYGQGDEAWRFHSEADLRKATALRGRPIPVKATYVAPPLTVDKQVLLATDPALIDASGEDHPAGLSDFMRKVSEASTRS